MTIRLRVEYTFKTNKQKTPHLTTLKDWKKLFKGEKMYRK